MSGQTELEDSANAELERLQRQLRTLQLELRILLEHKTKLLKKQNHIISVLQKEHKQLISDINILEEGTHAKKNVNMEKTLMNLKNQESEIQTVLGNERMNLWELEGRIKKMEKQIDGLRILEVPDNCYKDTICKVQKSVVKLENRLDVVNKKCSGILTDNSKLRSSINHMLHERAKFNEMWQTMVNQFNEGKKYIMDLIDQSTVAYDQREELCNMLQVLKDRNENDKIMHIQEMREMQRRLEHDAKLQKFFDIKGQKRVDPELEQRENDKKLAQKGTFEKQLGEYNEIVNKMKELYQESDTQKLTDQFRRQEEENFALFNYVNELSHEVEVLHDTTQDLSDKIEQQKAELLEKEAKQKTEALDYLNEQLEKAKLQNNQAKEKLEMLDQRLQQMLLGIGEIFRQLSCDDAPILNVLSTKTSMTSHNVKLFVGVIEKRIAILLNGINIEESSNKILAKKGRIPKFNLKEPAKTKKKIRNK